MAKITQFRNLYMHQGFHEKSNPRRKNKYICLNDNFFLKKKITMYDTKKPPIGEKK